MGAPASAPQAHAPAIDSAPIRMTTVSHREIENRGAAPKLSIATPTFKNPSRHDIRVAVNVGGSLRHRLVEAHVAMGPSAIPQVASLNAALERAQGLASRD